MKKDNEKKKKRINKRKVFRTVTALFFTLLTVLSMGIQAAAAFLAAGAIEGIVAICVTIAAACGLMSQSEAENMAVSSPDKLAEMSLNYIVEHGSENVAKTMGAAGKMAYTVSQLQETVDDYFGKAEPKTDTSGKPILGGASITGAVSDFIQSSQSHVKQVADGSIDMKGYGALIIQDNHASRFHMITMVWGDYIVVRDTRDYAEMVGCKYIKQTQDGTTIVDKSSSSTSPFALNAAPTTVIMYGDVRYKDGTKADDYTTSVDSKPASIGEVTDADGNTYPVNADGTVTVNGEDIPINEDGTVTINGDTYNVTYNLSNYDDTAVIDLLRRILEKIDNSYVADDNTLTDELPTTAPAAVTGEDLLSASSNAINFIPYDGLESIFKTLQETTFVDKAPEDIVITLDTNFYKGSWVLIPASIIDDWAEALNVVKLLVSTVLLWVFAMWVRRLLFKNLFT